MKNSIQIENTGDFYNDRKQGNLCNYSREKVVESEKVYRAYMRPIIRKEQCQQCRAWKCQVLSEKGNWVLCKGQCSECEYVSDVNKAIGNVLSLAKLLEYGVEIAKKNLTSEDLYI